MGEINRAKAAGLNLYCDRKCAGLGRRSNETEEEKKFIKYLYDRFIFLADETLKQKKSERFKIDYRDNPDKYKAIRQRRMKDHIEYCRRPEYKAKKKVYDQQYRSKKLYGQHWESAILLRELGNIVDNRLAKAEQKNITKSQKRKRNAKKYIKRQELEKCSMGLYQPS